MREKREKVPRKKRDPRSAVPLRRPVNKKISSMSVYKKRNLSQFKKKKKRYLKTRLYIRSMYMYSMYIYIVSRVFEINIVNMTKELDHVRSVSKRIDAF